MTDSISTIYAAIAVREYGAGRICIHTDRISPTQTGHQANSAAFWRGVIEWTAKKATSEIIRVGLIISTRPESANKLHSLNPVSVKKISMTDISLNKIDDYDLLYFSGLPDEVTDRAAANIKEFVEAGGGIVIESPDRGDENINVIRDIEDVFCYSEERPLDTLAYWTEVGSSHYMYYDGVDIAFMCTLRESDFSSQWSILMNNVATTVTTTTLAESNVFNFDKASSLEFAIGFISSMQNGIVHLETGEESSSSSSSPSSSSSSSSSSVDSSSSSTSSSESSSSF
jgi:hypothetical protein